MIDYPKKAEGGCLCGAVRYETNAAPDYVAYCHCNSCRRATGAPAVVYVTYLEQDVKFTRGVRQSYESTPGVLRTFCGKCGTPLSYEAEWNGDIVIGFFVGTMDQPNLFPAQRHVAHAERVSWYDASDSLPRYLEFPVEGEPPHKSEPAV